MLERKKKDWKQQKPSGVLYTQNSFEKKKLY